VNPVRDIGEEIGDRLHKQQVSTCPGLSFDGRDG
jgi:hypothetical protein